MNTHNYLCVLDLEKNDILFIPFQEEKEEPEDYLEQCSEEYGFNVNNCEWMVINQKTKIRYL